MSPDVIVIGGGIAGLATAWHLALRGARPCLLEREPLLAAHSSGRNAAVFRQIDGELTAARLAQRTRQLLGELGPGLLSPTGAIYVGEVGKLAIAAAEAGVGCEQLDAVTLRQRVPLLEGGDAPGGLFFPGDGVLDLHALVGALSRGANVRTRTAVRSLKVHAGKLEGVILESGEALLAPKVVMAAGAWTAALGRASGVPLPIEPRRRHLAMLVSDAAPASGPVVWRLGEEVYFRPETGGVLASPCDEQPWAPGFPPPSPRCWCNWRSGSRAWRRGWRRLRCAARGRACGPSRPTAGWWLASIAASKGSPGSPGWEAGA